MKITDNKKILVCFLLVVLLIPQFWVISFSSVKAADKKMITGLYVPTIDGFIDNKPPLGYLGEWGDAYQETVEFLTSKSQTVEAELYTKYVAGTLFGAFEYPDVSVSTSFYKRIAIYHMMNEI